MNATVDIVQALLLLFSDGGGGSVLLRVRGSHWLGAIQGRNATSLCCIETPVCLSLQTLRKIYTDTTHVGQIVASLLGLSLSNGLGINIDDLHTLPCHVELARRANTGR
jgi:hypothetical protein